MKKTIAILLFFPIICFGQWISQGFINGQAFNDNLGSVNSMAIDAAGDTMAIGSARNSQLGTFFGYAKVLDWNGTEWIQRGETFNGSEIFLGTGSSVDLTADGNTLVVSSPYGFNSINWKVGLVRVFDWNGTEWIQRGNTLEGEGNISPLLRDDVFGLDVSITPDGNFLAIGAPGNTKEAGVLQIQGHARVFQWDGQSWTQMGQDIDGVIGLEEFGGRIDLSADGTILVVGSRSFRAISNENYIGSVQTFTWDGTQWSEFGQRITGLASADRFGSSVSLSNDGSTLAIGCREVNGNESAVLVFEKGSNSWNLKGLPILGILDDLGGSTCSLNSDGSILGVGFQWTNFISGVAKIFQWNGSNWTQIGANLFSTGGSSSSFHAFGSEICLSENGSRVLVGASGDDTVDSNSGKVYMFRNTTLSNDIFDDSNSFTFYPNPTKDVVHFSSKNTIENITIYNVLGQEVVTKKVNAKELTVDVSHLSNGSYFVRLDTTSQSQTLQFIKF
jgi:hypothetical protein